jgi:hypothetical protein
LTFAKLRKRASRSRTLRSKAAARGKRCGTRSATCWKRAKRFGSCRRTQ